MIEDDGSHSYYKFMAELLERIPDTKPGFLTVPGVIFTEISGKFRLCRFFK